jgi:hypothetical protein
MKLLFNTAVSSYTNTVPLKNIFFLTAVYSHNIEGGMELRTFATFQAKSIIYNQLNELLKVQASWDTPNTARPFAESFLSVTQQRRLKLRDSSTV